MTHGITAPLNSYVVECSINNNMYLIRVDAKDTVNAVLDALWPCTVWDEEYFNSVVLPHLGTRVVIEKGAPHAAQT